MVQPVIVGGSNSLGSNSVDSCTIELSRRPALPSILLTNANRVLNKIDELYLLTKNCPIDIICITESWLDDGVPNCLCDLPEYRLFRKDRMTGPGGGVMCYVADSLFCDICKPSVVSVYDFEVLWVVLRPKLLPRPLSVVVLAVVYCPPWYTVDLKRGLSSYITACIDFLLVNLPLQAF